jgi:PPOX class probable F420-dependent enzyme
VGITARALPRRPASRYNARMPSRRDQIALSLDEQRAYLEHSHTIILGTLDPRGYPHLVAMWYVADPDGTVLMTTFGKAQKVRNLERDPRCSLLLESEKTYDTLKGLLIRGRATIIRDAAIILDTLLRVNRKYQQGPEELVRPVFEKQAQKRVLLRITPERIASWDHAKLGGGY